MKSRKTGGYRSYTPLWYERSKNYYPGSRRITGKKRPGG